MNAPDVGRTLEVDVKLFRARRKTLVAGLVIVALAGGGGAAWAMTRDGGGAAPTTRVATAELSDMSQTVEATGTVEPKRQADLSFTVSGTVTRVSATVGEKVKAGTALATIDDATLQSALDTAKAAVTSAEQQVDEAASGSDTQQAAAEAQLAQARSQLAQAQDDVDAATLRATFAGVVASVNLSVGDVAAGGGTGSSSGGGSQLGGSSQQSSSSSSSSGITVISTDAWVVQTSVGSADLAKLKKGLQAQITPSGSSTTVYGTVSSIGIVATSSTSGSATFPVTIDVTGSPTGLYSGGSASVRIVVKKVADVLTVPTQAITTRDGKTYVARRVNGKDVQTMVTVGTAYGPQTEITKGLAEGDQVVYTFRVPNFGGGGGRGGNGGGSQGGFPGGDGGFTPPAGFTGGQP